MRICCGLAGLKHTIAFGLSVVLVLTSGVPGQQVQAQMALGAARTGGARRIAAPDTGTGIARSNTVVWTNYFFNNPFLLPAWNLDPRYLHNVARVLGETQLRPETMPQLPEQQLAMVREAIRPSIERLIGDLEQLRSEPVRSSISLRSEMSLVSDYQPLFSLLPPEQRQAIQDGHNWIQTELDTSI